MIDGDVLFFFEGRPKALALYDAFSDRVQAEFPDTKVKVQKSQISFSNRRMFACASLLPARPAGRRPKEYLTITFGLDHRLASPRIDAVSEPYPNRWIHHVLIASEEELDGELMGWIREAYHFSVTKR